MARFHNTRVRERKFEEGELVLRKSEVSTQETGKLYANWEGPYKIAKVIGKGAYKLKTLSENEIPRSWNVEHLRKFHQ